MKSKMPKSKKSTLYMKEEDIRPERLKHDQQKAISADIRYLLRFRNKFVKVSCPACGADNFSKAFAKNMMNYLSCKECRTLYVNPRPTPPVLENFYRNSKTYKYWKKYIFPASEDMRRKKIFRPRAERVIELCNKYKIKKNLLLEVGAGFGTFCEEIKHSGSFRRVIAVEPTSDLARKCRSRGLTVIEKPIEKVKLEANRVDVVASFEVIEHLFSPVEFIYSCASLLVPGGLLVLSCPNCQGFDISVMGKVSDSIDHEHLNYFNPDSLSRMISSAGFKVLEVLTPGKLDAELVRKKVLSGKFDISHDPFLKFVLIEHWQRAGNAFQKFLMDNRLSSHMWIVARKL